MSVDGTPKFGTIAVKEITADITQTNVALSCKAAFVNRATGATHGWTQGTGAVWSKETMDRLLALQESMESDLARIHFEGVETPTRQNVQLQIGGIAEHLDDADPA